ncbi:ABC transporter substrate-binding protein [Bosea sp. (in: a-proteobacteria)]|uniref:ABC transporter substrate-binding protein n=1 Tax=Bosea sp. (in: a-proteobacteria) TaxID=1871050 RepID=UPI0026273324|nr:ABC transporter substrate-binding protein [Bosea sp. (in: a-proteobacteria)]MCO5091858.1 ABC transporter substrate-binding protein [Bosea sp. (in: a-proteobacteria)]
MKFSRTFALAAAFAVGAALSAPGWAQAPKKASVLRYAVPLANPGLDPARIGTLDGYMLTAMLFSNLVHINPELKIEPQLATSWETSPDGLSWTFHLSPNVKFHDGRALVAEDVAFSIKRIIDPKTASRGAASFTMIKDVVAVDDKTVRFDLNAPYADLPFALGGPFGRVIDKANLEQISTAPNGTGPFVLKEYVPGSRAVFARNPNYFEAGLPLLDQVQQIVMSEPASQITALTRGEIQILDNAPKDLLGLVSGNKDIKVLTTASPAFQPFVTFVKHRPFDDVRVRQALKLALDRDALLAAATAGYGVVGNDSPVVPGGVWANADLPQRKRDVAQARKLLAEAGFKDGLDLTLVTTSGRPGLEPAAVVAQQNLKDAGFRVKIESTEMAAQTAMLRAGGKPFTIANINWAGRGTIDESLTPFYGTNNIWNFSGYSNPRVDELLLAGRSATDQKQRKAAYDEIQKILWEEGPEVVPYFVQNVSAVRAEVQDYVVHPLGYVDLRRVSLKN